MDNMQDAAHALYDDKTARPEFYNEKWSFDPLQYLRKSTDEEGRMELTLDIKYRKHWFRLVYPEGKTAIVEKDVNDRRAIITVRIYTDKKDDPDHFIAEGTGIRYYGDNKPYERYYVDWARTAAIGNALSDAGFDVPWCNKPTGEGFANAYTGETITYEDYAPPAIDPNRQYADVTAPPPDTATPVAEPQLAGQQQFQQEPPKEKPAPAPTPKQQAASPPAQASAPAPTPAQQQAAAQSSAKKTPPSGSPNPKDLDEALALMTVELALSQVIGFGKHKGLSLGEVAKVNPADIDWIANKYQGKDYMLKAGAKILADTAIRQAS